MRAIQRKVAKRKGEKKNSWKEENFIDALLFAVFFLFNSSLRLWVFATFAFSRPRAFFSFGDRTDIADNV